MKKRSWTWATAALVWTSACATEDPAPVGDFSIGDKETAGGKADDLNEGLDALDNAVCLQRAAHPSSVVADALADIPGAVDNGAPVIANYTAWPVYDPFAETPEMPADVVRQIDDPEDARRNLASRYAGCEDAMATHLEEARPNVYIYFTGFGGAAQNNSLIGQGAVLRWINDRDPNALIFSINWNCAESSDPWCAQNTQAIASTDADDHVASMNRAIDVIVPQVADPALAAQLKGAIGQFGQQQQGYDSAHSHSMLLAAKLIDQLLVADDGSEGDSLVGDIHVLGYSMGAHSAAQLLVQDFTGDGDGFEWSRNGCEDGGDTCTVAELSKVKWSLAMGLSGWSHALRTQNRLDSANPATLADREQYENGGLFRVDHADYRDKLAVLNRRMDPTSNSDDTFQRGFLDIFFGDYNHYSHDYDLPLFVEVDFIRVLDAFLENPGTANSLELGIIADHAGKIDFDECQPGEACEAGTDYVAHLENRSHAVLDIPQVRITATDGVAHPDNANNAAADLSSGDAIAVRTFDQEDLRGGVELHLRPHYDVSAPGMHGVFSYGGCEGSDEDLMPQAFVQDGELVMQMTYQGESFEVRTDATAAGLRQDQWTHLAFNWELPVESLTRQHANEQELIGQLPGMLPDLQRHQVALVLATGLSKPLATTYKRQRGEGSMTIFANGEAVATAALGNEDSTRECMSAAEVLSDSQPFDVNGEEFPAFVPYARYDAVQGDIVAFSPEQILGTKCKAYRVRNEQAFFGCAQSDSVNADADMDDIVLVWGPGRTDFDNIDHETGAPQHWPIGVDYGPDRFRVGERSGGGDNPGGEDPGGEDPPAVQTLGADESVEIPDASNPGASSTVVAQAGPALTEVSILVEVTHTWRSDLAVVLVHNGEQAVLHNRSGGSEDNLRLEGTIDNFDGMDPEGEWTLHVLDLAEQDTGTLDRWQLTLR